MDREKVVKGLNDIGGFIAGRIGIEQARNFLRTLDEAIALLKEQEPRTAHWFISEYEYLTCSRCGESYYTDAESTEDAQQRLANGDYYKFCPYCGAKMTDRR